MTIEASLVYSGATHAANSYWDVEDPNVFDDCSRFFARCLRRGPIETLAPRVGVGVSTFDLWNTEFRVWDGDTDAPDFSAQPPTNAAQAVGADSIYLRQAHIGRTDPAQDRVDWTGERCPLGRVIAYRKSTCICPSCSTRPTCPTTASA